MPSTKAMYLFRNLSSTTLTKRFLALAAMLFVMHLLAPQGIAAVSHEMGSVEACALSSGAQDMDNCSTSQDRESCTISCTAPSIGKLPSPDLPFLPSSPYMTGYLSHTGRLLSGPEPFPPKFFQVS